MSIRCPEARFEELLGRSRAANGSRETAVQFLAFVDALPELSIRGFDASEIEKTGRIVRSFPTTDSRWRMLMAWRS